MRLFYQLGLVTLLTLLLPWSGCQLMREVEQALRQEQQQALLERARLLARVLAEAPPDATAEGALAPLYLAPHPVPVQLDGYADEWAEIAAQALAPDLQVQLIQAPARGRFLLLSGPASAWRDDQGVLLAFADAAGTRQLYWLPLARPGVLGPEQRQWQQGRWQSTRAPLVGAWQHERSRWTLELALPPVTALALTWVQPEPGGYRFFGSWGQGPTPSALASQLAAQPLHPLLGQDQRLNARLAELAPTLRARVLDGAGFVRARSGVLLYPPVVTDELGLELFRGLYGLVLDQRWGLEAAPGVERGRILAPWLQPGSQGTRWYQGDDDPLTVAAWVPLGAGTLLLEQSSEPVLSLNSRMWLRLIQLFGLSSLLVLLGLWGYAFWLSWRVRRLHRELCRYRPDRSEAVTALPRPSCMPDELGDLSRALYTLQQQVQEYTRYLETLAGKLAHELRTPLAVVQSSLDNLECEPLAESGRTYLDRARQGGQRLGALVDAMSAARRLEQAIAQAEPEWFALDQLLKSMSDVYAGLYPRVHFEAVLGPGDYRCYGDPALLVQLLDKLVSNAVDFTPDAGQITLSLSTHERRWCLAVDNEGPLLPEAMCTQIFQSLVSLRPDNSRGHLGLGLYLVRLICSAFGGTVDARNRADGRGVQINCWLPVGGLKEERSDETVTGR